MNKRINSVLTLLIFFKRKNGKEEIDIKISFKGN